MDLTSGRIGKTLVKFSMPIVLAFLLQSIYGVADLFVVGHFGGTFALAGVNMGSQIMDFVLGIATGLLGGGRIIIAQYTGSKRTEDVKQTIITLFQFIFFLSLFLTVVLLLLCSPILAVMQTPAESYSEARNYYMICSTGILFIFGYNTVSAVLNGLGDSRTPLYFVVISTFINIILDLTLVGAFHMGAFGAGLATVIAQGISFLLGILYLVKKGLLPKIHSLFSAFHREIARDFLRIGIPSCYQNSILNVSLVALIVVLWWFFGGRLLGFFTTDPRTIALGTVYLKAHCWDYLLVMPAAYCLGGLFAGTGHTGTIAVANTVGAVISRIPLCILLGTFTSLGVVGIGLAFPISTAVTVLVYLMPFFQGVWKESAV